MSSSTPSCLSCLDELAGNPRRSRNSSFSGQISAIRGNASVADAGIGLRNGGASGTGDAVVPGMPGVGAGAGAGDADAIGMGAALDQDSSDSSSG